MMSQDQEDRQTPSTQNQQVQNSDNSGAQQSDQSPQSQQRSKIQLGNVAPQQDVAYQSDSSESGDNRPKVTMDMLEEDAPGLPSQTLVVGLGDSDDKKEENRQTWVTGPQLQENKKQSVPTYVSASQVENKPNRHLLLKLILTLITLSLVGAGAYGISLLL